MHLIISYIREEFVAIINLLLFVLVGILMRYGPYCVVTSHHDLHERVKYVYLTCSTQPAELITDHSVRECMYY